MGRDRPSLLPHGAPLEKLIACTTPAHVTTTAFHATTSGRHFDGTIRATRTRVVCSRPVRTRLSPANPFDATRYGYLWETLRAQAAERHLDYGAYDGAVVARLMETGVVRQAVGIDVNAEVVRQHANRMPSGVSLQTMTKGDPLPFDDASFDSASVLDVIEHIVDQRSVLAELRRVLRPGGTLVVTVPRRHVFSFLDLGNLKFRFPRAHARFYTWRHGETAYRERYVVCENGLFGDIEVGKGEHQHFDPDELARLVGGTGFDVIDVDGAGLFARFLAISRRVAPRPLRAAIDVAMERDAEAFEQTHLFLAARRR